MRILSAQNIINKHQRSKKDFHLGGPVRGQVLVLLLLSLLALLLLRLLPLLADLPLLALVPLDGLEKDFDGSWTHIFIHRKLEVQVFEVKLKIVFVTGCVQAEVDRLTILRMSSSSLMR